MKTHLSILVFLLSNIDSYAIGWGDWQRDTPYGNYMYDAGGGASFVFRKLKQEITGMKRWYFYKGCTIGHYKKGYFIADEQNIRLKTFTNQQEWEAAIVRGNLKPSWIRWYRDDWHFLDDLLLVMILAFYISIPVLIVLLVIVFRAIVGERLNPRKPCSMIVIGITFITAVQYFLEINPVSM